MNNAGIVAEIGKGLLDQRPESFDRVIGVNLTGVYNGVLTFGPGMRDRGEGHIVNTSSSQGVITSAGVAAYGASKFGVVALSEAPRDELAPSGVGVSVLWRAATSACAPPWRKPRSRRSTTRARRRPARSAEGAKHEGGRLLWLGPAVRRRGSARPCPRTG